MKLYKEKIFWDFYKNYNYKNLMQIPKIKKIVVSMGCGAFFLDKKKMQEVIFDLSNISNQKPINLKLKKSISNFKARKGNYVGIKVTLRSNLIYTFIDKLINIVLPKLKNFKGFSKNSFDNFGNFNFGLRDYSIFLEIDNFNFNIINGLNINIIIKSENVDDSIHLLKLFNFPLII